RLLLLDKPELLDAGLQGRRLHAEKLGSRVRPTNTPTAALQRAQNMVTLGFIERSRHIRGLRSQCRMGEPDLQRRTAAEYHRPLDYVAEFTDVAGPRIGQQGGHRIVGDGVDRLAHRVAEFLDEGP